MMQQLKYTTAGIATVCAATHAGSDQVPPSQWRAAMHALLRHGHSNDGTEAMMRRNNGLHPLYFKFHKGELDLRKKRELLKETMGDIFDAVSIRDAGEIDR